MDSLDDSYLLTAFASATDQDLDLCAVDPENKWLRLSSIVALPLFLIVPAPFITNDAHKTRQDNNWGDTSAQVDECIRVLRRL